MKKLKYISIAGLLVWVCTSCTSARWTVKDKSATDTSDYKVLEQKFFLHPSGTVTPDNPILRLDLLSQTKYQYTQRVLVQRNIQEYRLRPGFVALGLGSAAMAFYVANSPIFRENGSSTKSLTLNAAGALLAFSGFINMKPVGEPRPTGEERYLRSTGDTLKIDTLSTNNGKSFSASIKVQYADKTIFEEENKTLTSGRLEIPLANKISELQLSGEAPGSIRIAINFQDSSYSYIYPVESVLQPYAKVNKQLTELRSSPKEIPDNILADLVRGSQVRIKDSVDDQWYRVLYGISENYILKQDADLVWRPSNFAEENEVVTVPRVPFGNIDVESNIPILRGPTPNAMALILTNENYSGNLPERNYTLRDGRLIHQYLANALGFSEQNIYELRNINEFESLRNTLSQMEAAANDSTELFVYLSGYGGLEDMGGEAKLTLQGINDQNEETNLSVPLDLVFREIAGIPSQKTVVVGDIDFSRAVGKSLSMNDQQRMIDDLASIITDTQKASILMGQYLNQPSNLYVSNTGEDKKHHIFPYFFARALQLRRTSLSDIYQYLERNVSYTARRLHDRPQDPIFLGRTDLDLTGK